MGTISTLIDTGRGKREVVVTTKHLLVLIDAGSLA